MYSTIEKLKHLGNFELWKDSIWGTSEDNEIIELYNKLPDCNEDKKTIWEYLKLRFSWLIWQILEIDLWEPLKEALTPEEELQEQRLFETVKTFKEKYKNLEEMA